ncbi:MAG TPA: chemotaxis protein CheW [Gemmatimonadaceae bacterium]|nr:chemotaxis protein CheW [Gemmatimonadaceae bacterium]
MISGNDTLDAGRDPFLEALAAIPDAPPADHHRLLVFAIAGRTRCCDLDHVREIVPNQRTTRLPGAPRFVRGLINLRGNLVTVVDAALSLYGVPADESAGSILLVESRGRIGGVLVDNVFDIQALPASEVDRLAVVELSSLVERALA